MRNTHQASNPQVYPNVVCISTDRSHGMGIQPLGLPLSEEESSWAEYKIYNKVNAYKQQNFLKNTCIKASKKKKKASNKIVK